MSYIAKEPLVSAIEETLSKSCNMDRVSEFAKGFNCALATLLGLLRQLPDPDVVPKSEVTKLRENEAKWQEMYAESQSKWEKAYESLEVKLEDLTDTVLKEFVDKLHIGLIMYGQKDKFNKTKFLTLAEEIKKEMNTK